MGHVVGFATMAVVAAALVLGSAAQAGVILNEPTFDKNPPITGTWPNPAEPITDGGGSGYGLTPTTYGGDTINGWTFYLEASSTNRMTFAPGSDLAAYAPDGVGEATLNQGLATKPHGVGGAQADVMNLEFGGDGAIAGIAQTFTSLGGEVTIEVTWHRHEKDGSGLDIVDGTGQFGAYDYTFKDANPKTYTHTFTPTQPQFRL